MVKNTINGAEIAKVRKNPDVDLAGKTLSGELCLEVPVQRKPIPESIKYYAKTKGVTIIDIKGKLRIKNECNRGGIIWKE